jgi:hypothetical protein
MLTIDRLENIGTEWSQLKTVAGAGAQLYPGLSLATDWSHVGECRSRRIDAHPVVVSGGHCMKCDAIAGAQLHRRASSIGAAETAVAPSGLIR